jgi:hypothetical protein
MPWTEIDLPVAPTSMTGTQPTTATVEESATSVPVSQASDGGMKV